FVSCIFIFFSYGDKRRQRADIAYSFLFLSESPPKATFFIFYFVTPQLCGWMAIQLASLRRGRACRAPVFIEEDFASEAPTVSLSPS
ncbi:MAG: hypothetical protein PHP98_11025, partial [Kiritimatiellae bacterium]|nr:hypothetical protein [Kiritimatiellia bacterium]